MAADKTTQDKDISDKALKAMFDALGGTELSMERNIYKPDICGNVPVIGYFVDCLDMPEADREENPEWRAFLVQLTHPTKVVNRKGEVIAAKTGEEIIFPAGFQLETTIKRFALDPKDVHELGVLPGDMLPLGGGKKMRQFRVKVTEKRMARSAVTAFDERSIARTINGGVVGQLASGEKIDADGRVLGSTS